MNKLPDTTIIEVVEDEEENELMDIKNVPKESPFEEEPKPVVVQEKVNYSMLTAKKLKELAKSKGYRGYSKLTKPNLIRMMNGENLDVIPTKKKSKPKVEKKLVSTEPKELQKEVISCKDVQFTFFGLSLATINAIISLLLSVITFRLFLNYEKN